MLQKRWTWVVCVLLAVTALSAFTAEGILTAAATPVYNIVNQTSDDPARAASHEAASTDLAALLAVQDRSRQSQEASVMAVACASAIPGVLLGIAFWFFVLWFWDRDNILPACVAGICSAASIFTLVAVPATADLWSRLFTPSAIHAIEAAGLSLLGIFSLIFLYLLYPSEVTSVRLGRIELKSTPTSAERPALRGGDAGRPAPSSGAFSGRPQKGHLVEHGSTAASGNEPSAPAFEKRRRINTLLLLGPVPALVIAVAAAFLISADKITTLYRIYGLLSLPIAIAVCVFLAGILRRSLPFSRIVVPAYGLMLIALVYDVLVRSGAFSGVPASPYAFAAFLAAIGWITIGHSLGRWKGALHQAWTREDELKDHHSAVVARARSLESSTQMQQRFVASTSHELRSPLTSILGFVELLEEELAKDLSASHRGFIQSIRESAHRLLQLVNDLLDLATAEDAALEMHFSAVDVDEVVDDAVRHIYPLAQVKRLAMYLEKEGLGARVWADDNRLRQVVINLLSNAVKFTNHGRVLVRVRSATLPGKEENAVAIDIEDTGRGISTDFMPRLFERFTREDEESNEGTGLGLAITREFVEAMGGQIQVESRLGKGSRFTILLPAVAGAS